MADLQAIADGNIEPLTPMEGLMSLMALHLLDALARIETLERRVRDLDGER